MPATDPTLDAATLAELREAAKALNEARWRKVGSPSTEALIDNRRAEYEAIEGFVRAFFPAAHALLAAAERTAQPDPRDAEIARLRGAVKSALAEIERSRRLGATEGYSQGPPPADDPHWADQHEHRQAVEAIRAALKSTPTEGDGR